MTLITKVVAHWTFTMVLSLLAILDIVLHLFDVHSDFQVRKSRIPSPHPSRFAQLFIPHKLGSTLFGVLLLHAPVVVIRHCRRKNLIGLCVYFALWIAVTVATMMIVYVLNHIHW